MLDVAWGGNPSDCLIQFATGLASFASTGNRDRMAAIAHNFRINDAALNMILRGDFVHNIEQNTLNN